jgi:hypothetical protein
LHRDRLILVYEPCQGHRQAKNGRDPAGARLGRADYIFELLDEPSDVVEPPDAA